MSELKKHEAYWTCCGEPDEDGGDEDGEVEYAYYFAPTNHRSGGGLSQRTVTAIIDIAQDGTLAGIELIDDMPPPPKPAAETED